MWIMAGGGFARLPDGTVVVALSLPRPPAHGAAGAWPWRPGPGTPGPALPAPTGWSAHADTARTVRAAAPAAAGPPTGEDARVRVLVHARNRARALTRLRNLGLRSVYLRGNAEPPSPDEITAVLHHPDGLVWRAVPGAANASWQPIGALLAPHRRVRTG
jgi:hypothetical protein